MFVNLILECEYVVWVDVELYDGFVVGGYGDKVVFELIFCYVVFDKLLVYVMCVGYCFECGECF